MDLQALLEPRRILQIIALSAALGSLIITLYRYHIALSRCTRRILITPLVFLSHMVLYYSTVIMSQEAIDLDHIILHRDLSFHAWAAGLSIHAIVTVIFLVYAYLKQYKLREELEQWNTLHKSQLF